MNKLILMLFALIVLPSVFAANWYVDNAVSSNGNGQSWNTAWKSFSNIAWASVQPGDTVYISGGTTSKTYDEMLDVQKGGANNNLVTIRKGLDVGHNGRVVIDRNFASGAGLDLQGINYVNVRDMVVQNTGSNAVYVRNAKYIYLDNMEVRNANGPLIYLQGYTSEQYPWTNPTIDNFYLRNSVVEDLRNAQYQTDLISMYYSIQNVFILNNTLRVGNTDSVQHTDCIQWYWGVKNVTIAGNWIENLGAIGAGAQNQAMMTGLSYGTIRVYNNVFYTPNFGDGVDPVAGAKGMNTIYAGTSQNARWEIIGNTFITGNNSHVLFLETPNIAIRNNLFYNTHIKTGTSIRVQTPLPATWNEISNNFYSHSTIPSNGKYINVGGNAYSIQEMQSVYSAEINSIGDQNPQFVDILSKNFRLQSTSPAIDSGVALGASYDIDIDGVSRLQGSAWDIGAYEYFSGVASCHLADINCDNCISLGEISSYVSLWLSGNGVTLSQVSGAVSEWMGGC